MKKLIPLLLLFAACHPVKNLQLVQPEIRIVGDTIREQMLLSFRPMGFCHARYGLAIVRDDTCRAHLFCNGRQIKAPLRVLQWPANKGAIACLVL